MTQRIIYQNQYPYFVTSNIKKRYSLFKNEKYTKLLSEVIFRATRLYNVDLYSYVIMPAHFHLLVGVNSRERGRIYSAGAETRAVNPEFVIGNNTAQVSVPALMEDDNKNNISNLMYGIKSYYVKEMRDRFDINYRFFQPRYNFRIINSERRLRNIIEYIRNNPVKAGLPEKFHRFPYLYFDFREIRRLFV